MRLPITAATVALTLAALAACGPRDEGAGVGSQKAAATNGGASQPAAKPSAAQPADEVRRISEDELRAAMDKGTVAVYDVRNQKDYAAGHIKGAKLVPYSEVGSRAGEFPKDKLIVTYCA